MSHRTTVASVRLEVLRDFICILSTIINNSTDSQALCMPIYLFTKMNWIGQSPEAAIVWLWNGGIFTLAPDDELNGNPLFPRGWSQVEYFFFNHLWCNLNWTKDIVPLFIQTGNTFWDWTMDKLVSLVIKPTRKKRNTERNITQRSVLFFAKNRWEDLK